MTKCALRWLDYSLELNMELPSNPQSIGSSTQVSQEQDELTQRLARLRQVEWNARNLSVTIRSTRVSSLEILTCILPCKENSTENNHSFVNANFTQSPRKLSITLIFISLWYLHTSSHVMILFLKVRAFDILFHFNSKYFLVQLFFIHFQFLNWRRYMYIDEKHF